MCVFLFAVCPGHLIYAVVRHHDSAAHGAHSERHEGLFQGPGEDCKPTLPCPGLGVGKGGNILLSRVDPLTYT